MLKFTHSMLHFFAQKGSVITLTQSQNSQFILGVKLSNYPYLLLHLRLTSLTSTHTNPSDFSAISSKVGGFFTVLRCQGAKVVLLSACANRGSSLTGENVFLAFNWLEREVTDMFGLNFRGKSDTRNLLMVYGDNLSPLNKFVPSVGYNEVFYNLISDNLTNSQLTLQY